MIQRASEALGVAASDLQKEGVFDAFLSVDSHFHIDPALVKVTKMPELASSYSRLSEYFNRILLLASKTQGGDALERGAIAMLRFPEIEIAGLGFARDSKKGRAFGKKLSEQIFQTARAIIRAGIVDSSIFELIGLFEEHVGADLISDMVLFVIVGDILTFNERVSRNLNLKVCEVQISKQMARVPCSADTGEPILLLPFDILSPLPVATCWDEVDLVSAYNQELREKLNKLVGITWRDATRRIHKSELKKMLLNDPNLFRDLLSQYKGKPAQVYDFAGDPLGEFIWHDATKDATAHNPLVLRQPKSHDEVVAVVRQISGRFKQLVEHNGLHLLLYDEKHAPRPERFSQLLFFGTADCYCDSNNLDLNREPNAGRGPVDFKISAGYHSRVTVEIKLSTNKKLISGFTEQLPAYDAAEKSFHSFFIVVNVGGSLKRLNLLRQIRADAMGAGKRVPEILVVDGTIKLSASKL